MKRPHQPPRWKRIVLVYLVPPLLFYLLICTAVFVLQRKMMYFPMPVSDALPLPCGEEALTVDGPSGPVQAWLIKPEALGSRPLLFYCGGNAEDATTARLGFAFHDGPVVCWNYPGFAGSAGAPSEDSIIAAGQAVLDQIARRAPQTEVIIMGRSLGAAVAVALATHRRPVGLILVSPSDSLAAVAAEQYPLLPTSLLLRDRWDSRRRCSTLDLPVLMLAGTADRTISLDRSRALADAWPGPVTFSALDGRGHNDIDGDADYWPAIERFCASMAKR